MEFARLNDYSFPDDRRVYSLLLVWAVLNNATVDEAFEFLLHGKKPVDHGRKKPFTNEEVKKMYDNDYTIYEIADMFDVNPTTIYRRLQKLK